LAAIKDMKKTFLIILLLVFAGLVKAQNILVKSQIIDGKKPPYYIDDSSILPDKNGVYTVCEHEPMFPGGQKAYQKFILKNLKWPDKSGMVDVRGNVIISFIVEKNGSLTNFKVVRKLEPMFDNAAVAALKRSPKWIPGNINRHVVRAKHSLSFNFSLQ
jgi:TonB family protein